MVPVDLVAQRARQPWRWAAGRVPVRAAVRTVAAVALLVSSYSCASASGRHGQREAKRSRTRHSAPRGRRPPPKRRDELRAPPASRRASSRPAAASRPAVQPIDDPSGRALDRFYGALLGLERNGSRAKAARPHAAGPRSPAARQVRVCHWGDSHVAGEIFTGQLRWRLQLRFGSAGPGFVLLGKPWRSYRHLAAQIGADRRWRSERIWSHYSRRRRRPRDELFGLAGISVHARRRAVSWVEARRKRKPFQIADVFYLAQPRGGTLELWADSSRVARVRTRAKKKRAAYLRVELPGEGARRIEVRARRGEVRLFGVDLRRRGPGVVYDAFGINGARASLQLAWDEPLMREQVQRLGPELWVLHYGSNEIDAHTVPIADQARKFDEVVQRMRRMMPDADCLIVGPPDQARRVRPGGWQQPKRLGEIIAAQRTVAKRRGCGFWDQRAAMGGPGSIFVFESAQPRLAWQDHVHLTGPGYRKVARQLFAALMKGYEAYRARANRPTAAADAPAAARRTAAAAATGE